MNRNILFALVVALTVSCASMPSTTYQKVDSLIEVEPEFIDDFWNRTDGGKEAVPLEDGSAVACGYLMLTENQNSYSYYDYRATNEACYEIATSCEDKNTGRGASYYYRSTMPTKGDKFCVICICH